MFSVSEKDVKMSTSSVKDRAAFCNQALSISEAEIRTLDGRKREQWQGCGWIVKLDFLIGFALKTSSTIGSCFDELGKSLKLKEEDHNLLSSSFRRVHPIFNRVYVSYSRSLFSVTAGIFSLMISTFHLLQMLHLEASP